MAVTLMGFHLGSSVGGPRLMIVCHCQVVNDGAVVESIKGGARTLANVCKSTGAGRGCGACVFSLKPLLCEHEASGTSPEVEVAAS